MKSNPAEYKPIIQKLLEKTRQRKVDWQEHNQFGKIGFPDTNWFRCNLGSLGADSFSFEISNTEKRDGSTIQSLVMMDQSGNEVFRATTNELPTSPEEEEVSDLIEEIYGLARRQALKIELKLEQASSLLDQV